MKEEEYASLRMEMLQRFTRIFEAGKFATGGIFGFIALYRKLGVDCVTFLGVLEVLVILLGIYGLNEFKKIYSVGTYIAVMYEGKGQGQWHRMSRRLGEYLRTVDPEYARKIPFFFRIKWGTDGSQFAFILLVLTLVSWLFCMGKGSPPLLLTFWTLAPLGCIFWVVLLLTFGLRSYRQLMEETWIRYAADWGCVYPDPYKKMCKGKDGANPLSRA